jgi:mRNA-degrading endonuclease toxin of MazEF toxin-antitoxin module
VVPISTAEHKAFPLRPRLAAGDGGLARDSWTRCDQVSTLEKATAVYPPLGVVNLATMERIQEAIKLALELP